MRDPAQRIRGRRHLHPGVLQTLDHAVPARGVGEGAVDENDGEGAWAFVSVMERSFVT